MNSKPLVVTLTAMLCISAVNAQNLYQIRITGTRSITDATGKIVPRNLNNAILLRDFAAAAGITNTSSLDLAYHIRGNDLGDTIDVIKRSNGATVYTLFGLYFGEDFGRMELPSRSGRQIKRLEYVYTDQNSHSLGSALLTTYYFLDASGNTNSIAVLGQMQYIVVPNATHSSVQICSSSFTTTRPWTFHQ